MGAASQTLLRRDRRRSYLVSDPVSLADLLLDHPFADDEGLLHTIDESMTAGGARARVAELVPQLAVEPGQAVAVMLPNGPELVCTMVAIWEAGGVYVPVNPRLPQAEVDHVIADTEPSLLVTTDGISAVGGEPRTYPDDVAFVVWTSGTTGRPKPILHTHTAYLELLDRVLGPLRAAGAKSASEGAERRAPTPNLIPVSMALNAGIYNALFGLRAGSALVIMDRFEPEAFAELVRRFQIRSTVLPPAAMAMLTDSDVTDLGPLRYIRSITAPLSPLQAQRFVARFGDVFILNGYGQAEMGEVIGWTAADAKSHPEKVGAVGRPHPGVEIRVSDDGHLLVRPPNAAVGIDERRDDDGFIDTGDLARIDDDGFVWIEGRAGDLINRGGNKVHPEAVEEVLRLHPSVAEASVVGVADDRLGEVPVAFVVGTPVDADVLTAHCREHLVPYKVPADYVWVDELPRSEVGKVLRRELAASYTPTEG
jgi:acyl-coenzyme A synthetase/AMP-(fatty) acid ligase